MGDEAEARIEWYSRTPSFRLLGVRDTPPRYRPLKPLPKPLRPLQPRESAKPDEETEEQT